MKGIRLLGTEKDKDKSFYWLATHMNLRSEEQDEFWVTIQDFKRFKRIAFLRRFKYEVIK